MIKTPHNPIGIQVLEKNWEADTIVYRVQGYNGTTTAYIPNIDVVATIDWGDGKTSNTTGGTSSASITHQYQDGVKQHTVIIKCPTATKIQSTSSALKSIVIIHHIPKNITSFSNYAFGTANDDGLNPLEKADLRGGGFTTNGANMFENCRHLWRVLFPNGMTTLANNTFRNCLSLGEIDLPETLTTIVTSSSGNPFTMSGLHRLYIPKNVKASIYPIANGCNYMEQLEVDPQNTAFWSSGNTIINRSTNEVDSLCFRSIIPESVTTLGQYCGAYMGGTSFIVPSHITTIRQYAFTYASTTTIDLRGCTKLTAIPDYCFLSADSHNIYLPEQNLTYGVRILGNTNQLVECDMGGGSQFGSQMFYTSTANTTFRILYVHDTYTQQANKTTINNIVFYNRNGLAILRFKGTITDWNNTRQLAKLFGTVQNDGSLKLNGTTFTRSQLTLELI